MKTNRTKKLIRTTLFAAAIASLLTVGAYAAGFLGPKAIIIPDLEKDNGETLVSITQPQAVPEDMSQEISEKVENARAAWAEWRNWRETSPDLPHNPKIFTPPENATISNVVDNEDGSCTLYYYSEDAFEQIYDSKTGEEDFSKATPLEVRNASAEEISAHEAFMEYVNLSYGDYDFNYDIHNEIEAAKLDEIAAKYDLRLRHGSTLLWSKETVEENDAEMNARYGTNSHTDTSDPRFLTNQELCDRIAVVACHGPLFRTTPRGFDKVYYFDEGTFCVSYYQELADGRRVLCYGYNSMYSTLSSGREVVSKIIEPERFQSYAHIAPDGTELNILWKDNEAFIYTYLADSFFEMHIQSDSPLSDADVGAVADNLNYSNIGR